MKKLLLGLLLGLLLLSMAACDSSSNPTEVSEEEGERFNGLQSTVKIIKDSETGCKYVYASTGAGGSRTRTLSPLMKNKDEADCGQ